MSVNVGRYVGLRRGKYWERAENSDYYCGGCGYPVTDHDSFCPECGGAFRESDASDLETENAKLREAVATAIKVQAVLCGDADSLYCRKDCPLHRQESDDCLACDVIGIAQELGIEVD